MLGFVFDLWMKCALVQVTKPQVSSQVASRLGQVSSQVSSHYKQVASKSQIPKIATRVATRVRVFDSSPHLCISESTIWILVDTGSSMAAVVCNIIASLLSTRVAIRHPVKDNMQSHHLHDQWLHIFLQLSCGEVLRTTEHKNKSLQRRRNANVINIYPQRKVCCLVTGPSNVKCSLWWASPAFQVQWLQSDPVVDDPLQPLWSLRRLPLYCNRKIIVYSQI